MAPSLRSNALPSKPRSWLRRLMYLLLTIIAVPVLYVLLSFLCLVFAQAPRPLAAERLTIAVIDNGVHADLVLPVLAFDHDWRGVFMPSAAVAADAQWIAIGWGDAEFYLHTPNWSDLRFTTAWRAITGQGSSLLHISYLTDSQINGLGYRVEIDRQGYADLARFILRTANPDPISKRAQRIADGYDEHDAFFAAAGSYSAVQTCNAWAGQGLAAAGVTVSPWTPFSSQVSWYLPAAKQP